MRNDSNPYDRDTLHSSQALQSSILLSQSLSLQDVETQETILHLSNYSPHYGLVICRRWLRDCSYKWYKHNLWYFQLDEVIETKIQSSHATGHCIHCVIDLHLHSQQQTFALSMTRNNLGVGEWDLTLRSDLHVYSKCSHISIECHPAYFLAQVLWLALSSMWNLHEISTLSRNAPQSSPLIAQLTFAGSWDLRLPAEPSLLQMTI